jgi:O-antigen/teichoic acid export membrane protein
MGSIRRQTIQSSILVYIGFFIGAINLYYYTRIGNGAFTPEQFGLTRIFFDFSQNMYAFGSLGIIPVIYKFYPYYKDNLEAHEIDLMTWALAISLIGFIMVLLAGYWFQPFFVHQFSKGSKLIVDYYYWMFPFAMGMLLFSVMEGFCWAVQKTVMSNFLKETGLRILTLIIVLLYYFRFISFSQFIHLFAFLYLAIFGIVAWVLYRTKKLHFPLKVSRVTKKFKWKMFSMQALIFGGTCIASLAATIDSFIIAKFQGLAVVAVFGVAQYAANLIQVPQRSIQSVSAGVLSRAWKDKNMPEINRIYQRSCINLLLIALFLFGNIWLNIQPALAALNIQKTYESGLAVVFILGMVRIIDAGTGLNNIVIGTSTYWRFDFLSGVVLLAFRLPLTYFLIKNYGIIGSAFAELIAFALYNFIRFEFLRRKFGMQPFNQNNLKALLLGLISFTLVSVLLNQFSGWPGIILRSTMFSILMILGVIQGKLTPDAAQLIVQFKNKWGIK